MYMCIHMSINTNSSAIKKNAVLPFAATQMDLQGIMLSEIHQTEKDNCCMILLIWGSKKIQQLVNITTKNRLTDRIKWWLLVGGSIGGEEGEGTDYWV